MRVKATQLGYYDLKRRPEGSVFELQDPKHFSSAWMAKLTTRPVQYEEVEEESEDGDIADLLGTGTKKAAALIKRKPVKKAAKPAQTTKTKVEASTRARRSSGDRSVI